MTRRPDIEPFAQHGELLRLLGAERDPAAAEAGPDAATRDRMWARLAGSLMTPPPARPFGPGKLLAAAAAVGALTSLAWWQAHRDAGPATAPTPPAVASPAAVPPPAAAVPAPSTSTTPLGELIEPEPIKRARPRPVDTLGQERKLVDAAREALAHGKPREAATLLDQHGERFSNGQLAEERESLLVRAELTLGKPAAARERAAAFLARYPDSLFSPIVRVLAARAATSAPAEEP